MHKLSSQLPVCDNHTAYFSCGQDNLLGGQFWAMGRYNLLGGQSNLLGRQMLTQLICCLSQNANKYYTKIWKKYITDVDATINAERCG